MGHKRRSCGARKSQTSGANNNPKNCAMSGLHTVPDAAEDQQLLLDVRALLERSQRQAAKNRALEAHRERVEATLGRVQEALGDNDKSD